VKTLGEVHSAIIQTDQNIYNFKFINCNVLNILPTKEDLEKCPIPQKNEKFDHKKSK